MASIRSGIELHDGFSGVLYNIIGAVNLAVGSMDELSQGLNSNVDSSSLQAARNEIDQATIALNELNAAAQRTGSPSIPTPEAAPVTPVWDGGAMDIFTNSGIGRFNQEAQSMNATLEQLSSTIENLTKPHIQSEISKVMAERSKPVIKCYGSK